MSGPGGLPLVGFSVANGLAPPTKTGADGAPIQGPRIIPITLNFTAPTAPIPIELFQENQDKQLDFVQTLYVDNSASGYMLTVRALVTNQTLHVPPYSQAYLPVLCLLDGQTQLIFSKNNIVAESVPVQLINVAMPAAVWPTRNLANSGATSWAAGQVTVGTAATLIVAARDRRGAGTIENLGTNLVALGPTNAVTLANGFPLQGIAGATITIPTRGDIWGIAGANQAVGYFETF